MNFFRRFRDAALCVILLAVPFFFLSANLRNPERTNIIDRLVLRLSAPIQYVAMRTAYGASTLIEDYTYLVDVRRDNERLRLENARLRDAIRSADADRRENDRLRGLLGLREQLGTTTLTAQVVGKEVSPFFRVTRLRLDRGARDRVRAGMPVISREGLVGQVRRAEGDFADVLLLVDSTSAVDVVIERNGARGIVRGTGETNRYAAQIQYLMRSEEIRVGDIVVTSGLGQRFPPNLPVGRVSAVTSMNTGMFQAAEIAPAADFSRLREALIVLTEPKPATTAGRGTTP